MSVDYHPNFGGLDQKTRRQLRRLSMEEQVAVAELVDGSVDNHYFYASKQKDAEASFDELSNIPYIYGEPKNLDIILKSAQHQNQLNPKQPTPLMFRYQLDIPVGAWQVDWTVSQTGLRMMELIEDRDKTIGEIVGIIASETNRGKDEIFKECKRFYEETKQSHIILLKGKMTPDFWKTYKRPLYGLRIRRHLVENYKQSRLIFEHMDK